MKRGHFHLGPHLPEHNLQIAVIRLNEISLGRNIILHCDQIERNPHVCKQVYKYTARAKNNMGAWISLVAVIGKPSPVVDCSYMQNSYSMIVKVMLCLSIFLLF